MIRFFAAVTAALLWTPAIAAQTTLTPDQREAHDIFRELIEINTSYKGGTTTPAAQAIARRFRAAGFPDSDITVIGPAGDKDSSVIVTMRGRISDRKPILLIAHLDVVEADKADWSVDPFTFTERGGYFYGRGTSDIKDGAATLAAALLRMKRNHITPDRTLVLALTAGEEGGGGYNAMSWLLKNHRRLIDAEYSLNVDAGDPLLKNGKHFLRPIQTSEKYYQSYALEVTNPGGHSSLPTTDNAIARLADAISRVARFRFPVQLTETTRAYFEKSAALETGQVAVDMRAIARNPANSPPAMRLSVSPFYNAQLRTTCVPTMIEGGHAPNALPQRVRAVINCRIMPGIAPARVQTQLRTVINDDSVHITPIDDHTAAPSPPSRLTPAVTEPIDRVTARLWPGVPVIPQMETGATDGAYLRAAGIPTYGVSGVPLDVDDIRAHGRDERIRTSAFYEGVEYIYELVVDASTTAAAAVTAPGRTTAPATR
jgi:acetylornithine deacetylase/succinyl-diaminopimelate desuccinylase-like protein